MDDPWWFLAGGLVPLSLHPHNFVGVSVRHLGALDREIVSFVRAARSGLVELDLEKLTSISLRFLIDVTSVRRTHF